MQEDRAIARERREEARQLNRLRREKLAGLYARLVLIGEGLLAKGMDASDPAAEDKFLEVFSQLTIEPGTERLTAAFQAFLRALEGPGEQASAREKRGAWASMRGALTDVVEAAREHLAELDKPVT